MRLTERLRAITKRFSQEINFYRLVLRHPRTPRASRFLLGAAIAYAASPIDLIPDFIPVIGYFDDVIVLPILIGLGLRLIPRDVIAECRNAQKVNDDEECSPKTKTQHRVLGISQIAGDTNR